MRKAKPALAYLNANKSKAGMDNPQAQPHEDAFSTVQQIVDLLSGSPELDIVAAERILLTLRAQARTVSGYPRLRPSDCAALTRALEKAVEANRALLVLGDPLPARDLTSRAGDVRLARKRFRCTACRVVFFPLGREARPDRGGLQPGGAAQDRRAGGQGPVVRVRRRRP